MRIINPIYDQAFKYLMENERIAKMILSLIIEKEIISLQTKPQEVKTHDPKRDIPLSRFDFKVIIKDIDNKHVNVLIEIQKSNKPNPIMRFRRYLGKNYIKQETFVDSDGKQVTEPLPIITIYFLGYNLAHYDTPAIVVNNVVKDTVNNCIIDHKDRFVELLTHPSYILQTGRLRESRKTRIEKFLAIFDQQCITNDRYILDIEDAADDNDIATIKEYLHRATEDEEMLLKLELEEDVEKEFQTLEKNLEKALLNEAQAQETLNTTIRNLHSMNMPIEQIASITGKDIDFVKQVIG
ncbi:MAG: hypothetical protein IPO21_13095 [Bacteroidales bacterium]|nr:hypothetical protein [Bacteroidales bacterium]